MGKIDLHLHTTASDGTFTPSQIVRQAAERGLEYIAITDHDTVSGIVEGMKTAADCPGLTLIPGLEINTDIESGEAHVLGYFLDYYDADLNTRLDFLKDSRDTRAQRMIAKLAGLDIQIEWTRVQELAGEGTVGRPHIARVLMEKGYISSFNEAFDKYLGHGCPAFVERAKISPVEAVEIIIAAGGLAVLAHPFTTGEVETMVKVLAPAGLCGLEAHYAEYDEAQVAELLRLCDKYGLIATGGTDFHGIASRREPGIGVVDIPLLVIDRLFALAKARGLKIVLPV